MPQNGNVSYGRAMLDLAGSIVPTFGNVFVVVNSNDSADPSYGNLAGTIIPDTNGQVRLFTSLETAYSQVTSNNNDVILLDAHSTHSLSAGLAVTKSRVHFAGMDGGDRLIQQGAKVQLGGAIDSAYVLKNTGVRNSFRDIKFIMASTHANALNVLQLGGEGSLFKNVSATFGVVDNLDQATAYEVLNGEDSGTFINCEFGTETLLTSAARSVMAIDQVTSSQEFKSNRFQNCNFVISSSETTATLLKVVAATDVLFTNNFKDCTFVASIDSAGGVALAVAVKSVASLVKGTLNFHNCAGYGATNFATDAVGNDNFFVYGAPMAAATDLVGVLPTAT